MSAEEDKKREMGSLLQAYARAKKENGSDQSEEVVRLSGLLGRELMRRVDALGFDADRLLEVAPEEALAVLDLLESEAALEDAGASAKGPTTEGARTWHNGRSVVRRRADRSRR